MIRVSNNTSNMQYKHSCQMSRCEFKNQTFGRLRMEHLKNGAYVDDAKNVFFKLFTFSDVKKVFVELKDKGSIELDKAKDGIFFKKILKNIANVGDKYRFKIERENGTTNYIKDPYAMKTESILDTFSEIYDHNAFKWSDFKWKYNKNRISRINPKNNSLSNLRLYEINITTVTKEGNFESAKAKIDELAKDKIFNGIHLMPVEATYSYNWGYDGVCKFAPQQSQMGGADKLKEFINYAHSKNINVIMDVVPNHIGPDGNLLAQAGPYLKKEKGPFGEQFNYENDAKNNKYVRDYIVNVCLNWLENYHCDGLRLDMTKFMGSDFTLKQIAMECHYHFPDAVLIAEDGRENLPKLTKALTKIEECKGKNEYFHAKQILDIDNEKISLENLGMDSEWDFPFFHAQKAVLDGKTKVSSLNTAKILSKHRLKYPMSHDEIGNMDGTRLITKLVCQRMDMPKRINGANEAEINQRAAHATQTLLTQKVTGIYDKLSNEKRAELLKKLHIKTEVSPKELDTLLKYAIAQNKLAIASTMTTPGPKMIFMGDENAGLTYFKFFRQFSPQNAQKDVLDLANKGYKSGEEAFLSSKLDAILYSKKYKNMMDKIKDFTKDLAQIQENNEALKNGEIVGSIIHDASSVLGSHLKKGNSELFTISNFNDISYHKNYNIQFPQGKWKEILNSNDVKYAGDGNYKNNFLIQGGYSNISLPNNSLLIFKKIS